VGINLGSGGTYDQIQLFNKLPSIDQAVAGDLIFYGTKVTSGGDWTDPSTGQRWKLRGVGHVAIYMGDGVNRIDALPSGGVAIRDHTSMTRIGYFHISRDINGNPVGSGSTPTPTPTPTPQAGNLLSNGSLEAGGAAGWARTGVANMVVYANSDRHSGASFIATNTTQAGTSIYTDTPVGTEPGDVAEGRVWLRSQGGTSTGSVCVWGLGSSASENSCTTYSVGAAWSPVEVSLGVAAAHSALRFEIYPTAGVPTVWADDATLTS
jgi:hypothetical protein